MLLIEIVLVYIKKKNCFYYYSEEYRVHKKFNKINKDCIGVWKVKTTKYDMASCMLSILDYLKMQDNCVGQDNMLKLNNETLSKMMFRKMEGYGIDLNKELGFTHLKPIKRNYNEK